MKNHQVLAAFALALAAIAASSPNASALRIIPIPWQPPPNPNHFRTFDATHDVQTQLTVPPQSTSVPLNCWYGLCLSNNGDFSADFGEGSDVASAWGLVWNSDSQVTDVAFDRKPGVAFEHLTGFYEASQWSVVNGAMQINMSSETVFPAGALVLGLQTQDDAGNWTEIATTPSPAMDNTKGAAGPISLHVSASLPGSTAVRIELRAGAAATVGKFDVLYGTLSVPECVPDESNPGTCLQ